MKTGFITLLISSLICSSVFAHDRGGMDGGGGGTLPADPASVYEVRLVAENARVALYFMFNSYEPISSFRESLHRKLYGGPVKVQDVLSRIRIDVREDKPCYDRFGKERDGSIFGEKPDTVCISAFSIAPKTSQGLIESEVIALLAHEVSHFLGTTESEAEQLQIDFRNMLIRDGYALRMINTAEFHHGITQDFRKQILSPLSAAIETMEKADVDLGLVTDQLSSAHKGLLGDYGWNEKYFGRALSFRFWEKSDSDLFDLLLQEVSLAYAFIDQDTNSPTSNESRREYDKVFGHKDRVTLKEIMPYIDETHDYKSAQIAKYESINQVLARMKIVEDQLQLIGSSLLDRLAFAGNWMPRFERVKVLDRNPWIDFAGSYRVDSSTCRRPQDLKDVNVAVSADEDVMLTFRGKNYSFTNRLALGAVHISASVESISSGSDFVQYQLRRGGTWENRQPHIDNTEIHTHTLKKISETQYEYHRKSELLVRDMSQPDQSEFCVIYLTKQ